MSPKVVILICCSICLPFLGMSQFAGGISQGFTYTILPRANITDAPAFLGGANDGFTQTTSAKINITDFNAFRGGNDDGFAQTILAKTNITDANAFHGGNDDGFAQTISAKINITDASAFRGGADDGFTSLVQVFHRRWTTCVKKICRFATGFRVLFPSPCSISISTLNRFTISFN